MSDQINQQAVVVQQDKLLFNKATTKLALFNEDGTPAVLSGSDPNVVKVTSQTFNSGQQTQVLTNIRALSRDVVVDAVSEGVPTDGTTSAAAPLNTTQALLPSSGGRLLLRRGSYAMTTRTTITKQGMVFEGEGPGATTMILSSAAFQVGASDVLIKNLTLKADSTITRQLFNNVTSGIWKNWRFENVKFDNVQAVVSMLGAQTDGSAAITTAACLTEHVEFDNCEFANCPADGVLFFRGTTNGLANRCWFHDCGLSTSQGDNLKFSYGASKWRALHCTIERSARDGIDCYDGHRGLIDGCSIDTVGAFGIEIKVNGNSALNPADRIQVVNNHVIAATDTAIKTASPNILVANNLLENGLSYGIRSSYKTNGTDRNSDIQWIGNRVKGFTTTSKPAYSALGIDGLVIIGNSATDGYQGFNVPLGASISQNQEVIGGATMNSSRNNSIADVWT